MLYFTKKGGGGQVPSIATVGGIGAAVDAIVFFI